MKALHERIWNRGAKPFYYVVAIGDFASCDIEMLLSALTDESDSMPAATIVVDILGILIDLLLFHRHVLSTNNPASAEQSVPYLCGVFLESDDVF